MRNARAVDVKLSAEVHNKAPGCIEIRNLVVVLFIAPLNAFRRLYSYIHEDYVYPERNFFI